MQRFCTLRLAVEGMPQAGDQTPQTLVQRHGYVYLAFLLEEGLYSWQPLTIKGGKGGAYDSVMGRPQSQHVTGDQFHNSGFVQGSSVCEVLLHLMSFFLID